MKAGDHIRITTGGVSEDAIDLGDRTVIHFVKGEGVKRSRLDQLAPNGARVEVVNHRHRVYAPKHVVARAFSRFSEAAYSAMFHGSEEFASWCKTGRMPARPFTVPTAATSPVLASQASARPRPEEVRRSPPRAAARPGARKPAAKKTPKVAAPPAKVARGAKKAPPAKRPAPAKQASAAKKPARPRPAQKPARAARPPARPTKPAQARKQVAPAASAKPPKRSTPAAAPKQKRGKAPGKRAAAGR